jgi:hypothetical protein
MPVWLGIGAVAISIAPKRPVNAYIRQVHGLMLTDVDYAAAGRHELRAKWSQMR